MLIIVLKLIVADSRLKSSQKFIKDQMAEREIEREEFDNKLETIKCQLREKKRESLETEDIRTHVLHFYVLILIFRSFLFIIIHISYYFLKTEQVMTEAEERYLMLENRRVKTEELLSASKLEVQTLKDIILTMENRIEHLNKNEIAQNDTINRLTIMLEEEQNTQQDMFTEVNYDLLLLKSNKQLFYI